MKHFFTPAVKYPDVEFFGVGGNNDKTVVMTVAVGRKGFGNEKYGRAFVCDADGVGKRAVVLVEYFYVINSGFGNLVCSCGAAVLPGI